MSHNLLSHSGKGRAWTLHCDDLDLGEGRPTMVKPLHGEEGLSVILSNRKYVNNNLSNRYFTIPMWAGILRFPLSCIFLLDIFLYYLYLSAIFKI
jgi:hypothetical protein